MGFCRSVGSWELDLMVVEESWLGWECSGGGGVDMPRIMKVRRFGTLGALNYFTIMKLCLR
jgi:hypothetical protein